MMYTSRNLVWKSMFIVLIMIGSTHLSHIAEAQGHHPDIIFGWGYAKIKIFTHKINGLVESDFILAAKINKI